MLSIVRSAQRLQRLVIIALTAFIPVAFTACGNSGTTVGTPAATVAAAVPLGETGTASILLFNGTGTTSGDVTAVEAILSTNKLAYSTANTSQLNAMTETQLKAYKLLIVPGGNSITIGKYLTSSTTTNVRNAVQSGLHYLGICAGGFFGGYSIYNGLNLTSGVWFNVYANGGNGTGKAAVEIATDKVGTLDQYWQDGPEFHGWGSVIGKYPDGTPAIVEGYSGSGWVILSGVHPEAPASWRSGMTFTTPVAVDNAYAGTLINAALSGTSLPHY